MNHGIVIIGDALESRIWQMAMNQAQVIAVYTENNLANSDLWHSTFVPPTRESLLINPLAVDLLSVDDPLYEWAARQGPHYIEYARYEPQYDEQFFQMCEEINGHRGDAVVVPAVTGDEEAMRLLQILHSLERPLHERYFDPKRQRSKLNLHDLLMPIRLRDGWAYLLGFVGKGSTNIFITDQPIDEAMVEEINADKYYPEVIEKW